MFNFGKVKDAIADLGAQKISLLNQIEEKRQKLKELKNLPLPQADYADWICGTIDASAREWEENLRMATQASRDSFANSGAIPLLETHGKYSESGKVFPTNLYGIFGQQIKAAVREKVMSWQWPAVVGPPRSKRPAAIAALEGEINELESQHKDLQRLASELGLSLDSGSEREAHAGGKVKILGAKTQAA